MNIVADWKRERGPDLSVVVVTRNDDHGGNLLGRMQHFVNGFIAQCRRHGLRAELIMVEWNPPLDRLPLKDVLEWPDDFGPAEVRIVEVPHDVHARFAHAEALPLFQMIGKNVGIRRARGKFVLATNVDILFDDALVCYLRDRLKRGTMLRADRYDVPSDIMIGPGFEDILADCAARFFQVQTRYGVFDVRERRLRGMSSGIEAGVMSMILGLRILGKPFREPSRGLFEMIVTHCRIIMAIACSLVGHLARKLMRYVRHVTPLRRLPIRLYFLAQRIVLFALRLATRLLRLIEALIVRTLNFAGLATRGSFAFRRFRRARWLHTNGCGDFTLLSREDWFRLRGYAEWPIFSWHLDSLFMYAANAHGIRQVVLNENYRMYHIDHSEGWSPEGERALFSRLNAKGIPFLTNEKLRDLQVSFANEPRNAIVNDEDWGLCKFALRETDVRPKKGTARTLEASTA